MYTIKVINTTKLENLLAVDYGYELIEELIGERTCDPFTIMELDVDKIKSNREILNKDFSIQSISELSRCSDSYVFYLLSCKDKKLKTLSPPVTRNVAEYIYNEFSNTYYKSEIRTYSTVNSIDNDILFKSIVLRGTEFEIIMLPDYLGVNHPAFLMEMNELYRCIRYNVSMGSLIDLFNTKLMSISLGLTYSSINLNLDTERSLYDCLDVGMHGNNINSLVYKYYSDSLNLQYIGESVLLDKLITEFDKCMDIYDNILLNKLLTNNKVDLVTLASICTNKLSPETRDLTKNLSDYGYKNNMYGTLDIFENKIDLVESKLIDMISIVESMLTESKEKNNIYMIKRLRKVLNSLYSNDIGKAKKQLLVLGIGYMGSK